VKAGKIFIFIILLIFFLFVLKSCALFFPFSFSDIFSEREPYIPNSEKKKEEPAEIPVFNVPFRPVTQEMKNMKVDCAKEEDGHLRYKKEKTLCRNVYTVTPDAVKNDLAGGKYSWMAFYGQYSIYHCPVNPKKQVENLVEGCIESAKFFDSYLFPKMASIYGLAANRGFFVKRLNIYIEEDESYVTKMCKAPAIGCCYWESHSIQIPLGTSGKRFYPEGQTYTVGFYLKDVSSMKYTDHFFQTVYPKNCALPQYTMHELIHYFNHRVYSASPSWFEETMDNILEDELVGQICPPGLKYSVFKYNGGRMDKVDYADVNSDDFILYLQDKRFEDNACYKTVMTQINRLFNKGKWPYFTQLYNQLNSYSRNKNYAKLTVAELAAAVYKSSGNDPEVKKNLYDTARCPKK